MLKKESNEAWWAAEKSVDEYLPEKLKIQWKSGYKNIDGIRNKIHYYLAIFWCIKKYVVKETVENYYKEKDRTIQAAEDPFKKNPYSAMHDSFKGMQQVTADAWIEICQGANQQTLSAVNNEAKIIPKVEICFAKNTKRTECSDHGTRHIKINATGSSVLMK